MSVDISRVEGAMPNAGEVALSTHHNEQLGSHMLRCEKDCDRRESAVTVWRQKTIAAQETKFGLSYQDSPRMADLRSREDGTSKSCCERPLRMETRLHAG
jgi:hypothetical protein